jgi:hypothetical protein
MPADGGQATATARAPTHEVAEVAIARMLEMSDDVRGCAVLGTTGEAFAATGDRERWQEAGAALLSAADRAGDEPAWHVHIGTEDGEVFAIRHGELAMIAVSDRFPLASLMISDMRMALRGMVEEAKRT